MNKEFFYKQLGQAIALTASVFNNITDKQGKPYILHCLSVMNAIESDDPEAQVCAVLHDVPEDADDYDVFKLKEILSLTERQTSVLLLLTHKDSESYEDYIKHISCNRTATKIKRADLEHNSNITRLKGLRKKDFDRLEKYHRAYIYLSE